MIIDLKEAISSKNMKSSQIKKAHLQYIFVFLGLRKICQFFRIEFQYDKNHDLNELKTCTFKGCQSRHCALFFTFIQPSATSPTRKLKASFYIGSTRTFSCKNDLLVFNTKQRSK